MGLHKEELELDVLIVGAGFGGLYQLHHFRKLGYSVKIFEAGSQMGGVWYWNCYPGARVDSPTPIYAFSFEEVWKDWTWTERFPGWQELRAYFRHVDQKLHLSKDVYFNTRVTQARWDATRQRWLVRSENGIAAHARFLVLTVGFASKPYIPAFKGVDRYEGVCHHTAQWPDGGVDLKGKKVAVIGTGASGVQVVQQLGEEREVEHLTVYQRTPNIAIPMRQCSLDVKAQEENKELYPVIFRRRLQTYSGMIMSRSLKPYYSMTPEERILALEDAYARGSFEFLSTICIDLTTNKAANSEVYQFWRKKTRARIRDPRMQDILAPRAAPHPMGARRHSLEQSYYEVFNLPNVDLVDTSETPITQFVPKGILTSDGIEREFDVIIFATGFDSVTGGITQIDIRGVDGSSIADKWKNGVYTNLGMTTSNFPNMFFVYGPQSPTAFANGPSCVEIQGNWIMECIKYMIDNKHPSIEATKEAEQRWRDLVFSIWDQSLLREGRSWWNGANIPGKVIEPLNFGGGLDYYARQCQDSAKNGYEGFRIPTLVRTKM
ncbi:hypothetical protein VNI00_003561 [Paramarasmius palmivorus]|uniref:L-ornithine N(5)-monooxygenase [NAD(P)H] n=1 Tax=Paramarasmius palmivorus TaxID=297713 RepID=A0AAW0DNX6_9AGAR